MSTVTSGCGVQTQPVVGPGIAAVQVAHMLQAQQVAQFAAQQAALLQAQQQQQQTQSPPSLTANLPDPQAIESYKNSCTASLEEQTKQGKDVLTSQQMQQAEYIKETAEAEKRRLIAQIDERARQQETALFQQYSASIASLEQQALRQKVAIERQASELSIEYHIRKSKEEEMQQEINRFKAHMEAQMKHQPRKWLYNPEVRAPIDIRATPDIDGERLPEKLEVGEVFSVSEEHDNDEEGVKYLKLADGRGWVFDKKPGVGIMCVPCPLDTTKQTGVVLQGVLPMAPLGAMPPSGSYAASPPPPASCMLSPGLPSVWIHQPDYMAPLAIREVPDINGARTPFMLLPGDVFNVVEELQGADGILYLKLADGRGWVFNRKPSVGTTCVRQGTTAGSYVPPVPGAAAPGGSYVPSAGSYVPSLAHAGAMPTLVMQGGSYVPPVPPAAMPQPVGTTSVPAAFPTAAAIPVYAMPPPSPATVTAIAPPSAMGSVVAPSGSAVEPPAAPADGINVAPSSAAPTQVPVEVQDAASVAAQSQCVTPPVQSTGVAQYPVPSLKSMGAGSPRYVGTKVTVYHP